MRLLKIIFEKVIVNLQKRNKTFIGRRIKEHKSHCDQPVQEIIHILATSINFISHELVVRILTEVETLGHIFNFREIHSISNLSNNLEATFVT